MDRAYASNYSQLYRTHWWWRARADYLVHWLRRICPPGGFGPILDVGCGDGLFFERAREFGVPEGVEFDDAIVTDEGRKRGTIYTCAFDRSFDPGRRYGLVLLLDLLEHLDDPVTALAHAATLLKRGGRILVTVPALRLLWTRHDDLNLHRRRYSRSSLARLMVRAAQDVEFWRYFFHFTVPLKVLQRAGERLLPSRPRPPAVPPPLLGHGLYWLSRAEQTILGDLPIPMGSSLLAITRSAI